MLNPFGNLSLLKINVAEVVVNSRVLPDLVHGQAKLIGGLVEPVLMVINPSEAILKRAIIGFEIQSFQNQLLSFIEPNAAVGKHVAQIVHCIRVFGIGGEYITESLFSRVIILLAL